MVGDRGMVIVGAGEAGARAAASLRELGWSGAITMIGEERRAAYERPPLSKAAITAVAEPLPTTILGPAALDELRIRHLAGRTVAAIVRAARCVHLEDGEAVPYERLLLAAGAEARRLPLTGDGAKGVMYLRRFEDACAIRTALRPGIRLVIIGGGFIGLELAASAVARGAAVTVLEAAERVLMRGVPALLAERIAAHHQAAGVDLLTGVEIERIDRSAVLVSDGASIPCDVVVAGVGALPRIDLAEAAGLAIDNGVRVDATLATDAPFIFAAGDCCSFEHPHYDHRRLRLEAWRNAQDQGALAARNMLGAAEPISALPWFWSDQYDSCLQIAGLPDVGAATVRRDLGEDAVLLFHLAEDGRLVAASGFGPIGKIAKEIRLAEMLIERHAAPAPRDLALPDIRLKSLAPRG